MHLDNLFVCPKCRNKLDSVNKQYYQCHNCHAKYPVLDDIPVFITEGIDSDKMSAFWDNGWKQRLKKTDNQFLLKENSHELRRRLLTDIAFYIQMKHTIMDIPPIDDSMVLNIGCGTGEAPMFTAMGANNYIGIDYSFTAAKTSFENIRKLGGTGITVQANAESLPIEDASIDIVYSNGVLHHTPETQKALDEVFRVMKPTGKAIIGLYNTWSPHFINERIIGAIKSVFNKRHGKWYECSENAWRTEGCANPWTKTYSSNELRRMFSRYNIFDLTFRKTGFSWSNAMPKIGKYIDNTKFGKATSLYLQPKLGSMWVIVFKKR